MGSENLSSNVCCERFEIHCLKRKDLINIIVKLCEIINMSHVTHRSKSEIDKSQKCVYQICSKFHEGHLKVHWSIIFCYFFDKNLITKVSISLAKS